jgi:hypothetical protein
MVQPKGKRAIYNSFSGLWRLNGFIDATQLEFSICFSVKDRDANYSLDDVVMRVGVLPNSKRSSLTSLRNQKKWGFGWHSVFLIDLLLVAACFGAMRLSTWLAVSLVVFTAGINLAVVRLYFRGRMNDKRLLNQLQSVPEKASNQTIEPTR